jgi:hypothetical protein
VNVRQVIVEVTSFWHPGMAMNTAFVNLDRYPLRFRDTVAARMKSIRLIARETASDKSGQAASIGTGLAAEAGMEQK